MALPSSGQIKASQINTEAGRSSNAEAPLSGSSSTPQAGSLVKIYEDSGVNQSAPHSYSEFYGKTFAASRTLLDVYIFDTNNSNTYYYDASIGDAVNLSSGDVIYTDSGLTTTLSSGNYVQYQSNDPEYHCDNSENCGMIMNINSSGEITAIDCTFCP